MESILSWQGSWNHFRNQLERVKFIIQNGKRALERSLREHLVSCRGSFRSWLFHSSSGWQVTFMTSSWHVSFCTMQWFQFKLIKTKKREMAFMIIWKSMMAINWLIAVLPQIQKRRRWYRLTNVDRTSDQRVCCKGINLLICWQSIQHIKGLCSLFGWM